MIVLECSFLVLVIWDSIMYIFTLSCVIEGRMKVVLGKDSMMLCGEVVGYKDVKC